MVFTISFLCRLSTLWRSESGTSLHDHSEVDIGIDSLSSGVIFSKAKAFDVSVIMIIKVV